MRQVLAVIGMLALTACDPVIVADTFEKERKLDIAELPAIDPPEFSVAVLVRVDEMGKITVDGAATDLADLTGTLAVLADGDPESRLVVQAHPGTKNGLVLSVRDAAQAAGFENISITLDFED